MENTSNSNAYPGYGTFSIEERNGYPQQPGAQWRIIATALNMHTGDPAYPRCAKQHTSLEGAIEEIKERLQAEHQRLVERAQGCLDQLQRMDQMYQPRPTPGQAIAAQRERLLQCLRQFKDGQPVGHVKFDGFSVALPYLHSTNVLVVQLPEYDAISPRFLASDIELLQGIVEEAGFRNVTSWNGAGCYTVSFQFPLAQLTGHEQEAQVA